MTIRVVLTFVAVVYVSWLAMQAVHELGHVLAAWLTGGTVVRVVLHPLTISRTDVSPNAAPLAVAWAGPLVGVAIPLLLALAFRLRRLSPAFDQSTPMRTTRRRLLADFFAGFCLVANGAYIGIGSFDHVGDAGDLLRNGSPQWLLIAFGLASATTGLYFWHLASKRPLKEGL